MEDYKKQLDEMKSRTISLPFGWNVHVYRRDAKVVSKAKFTVDLFGNEMVIWTKRFHVVVTKLPF